jgi:predicted O-linked N-acetylglucosamine transferase (SPINDLY family)
MIRLSDRPADGHGGAAARHQRELEHLSGNRPDPALAELEQALRLDPRKHEFLKSLGNAHKAMGSREQAVDCYRRSLALWRDYLPSLYKLGLVLHEMNRLEEAEGLFRRFFEIEPHDVDVLIHLGLVYCKRSRFADGEWTFCLGLKLAPGNPYLWICLRNALSQRGACDLAVRSYQSALELQPGDAATRDCLLFEMQNTCDWSRFDELCVQQRQSVSDSQLISPFSPLTIPSSAREQLQCARNFAKRQASAVAADRERRAFRFDRAPGSKPRIGYLSADFYDQVIPYLVAEMFELHERSRFETIAYSYGPDDSSPIRARLKRAFTRFVDVRTFSHAAAASAIHADRVDILVDLTGYTQHARTEIAALRPAPVQESYMGYAGTMAADFIDYFVVDRYVVPAAQADNYGESLVFMPGSYYLNDRKRPLTAPPPRRELGLPEKSFVFCCFDQTYKILPDVFARWMRLLAAVHGTAFRYACVYPPSRDRLRNHVAHPSFGKRAAVDRALNLRI